MKDSQVEELLYQALETEIGGVQQVTTAIGASRAAQTRDEMAGD